jgi:DNA invertase Pin-like site-specific DNA recombinase
MDAVIYTRVSRDKAEGRSVEDQERECRAECLRRGWEVRRVFCDNSIGASRYSRPRPQWEALKRDLRKGDVLVIWEASRAQRDLAEFVLLRDQCEELGVQVSYSGRLLDLSDGDDRFMGGMDALMSEREAEMIRKRTKRGKLSAANDGRPYGRAPWGLRRAAGEALAWEHDPTEAPRVREAVERMLSGSTQYSVWVWLRETGYGPTTPTALRRALQNPAIAGLRVHQETIVGQAQWDPIITEEQHHRLVALSRSRAEGPGNGRQPKHLLSSIAKCGVCGMSLSHRHKSGRKPYYACPQGHVARLVEMLDQAVTQAVMDRLSEVNPADYESSDPQVGEVLAEIEELEGKLTEWETAAVEGTVTPSAFGRIEKGLRTRIDSLRASITQPSELELDPAAWADLTVVERRQVVRALFEIEVPQLGRGRARLGDVIIRRI